MSKDDITVKQSVEDEVASNPFTSSGEQVDVDPTFAAAVESPFGNLSVADQPPPSISRAAPPKISPLTSKDIRYEQVINASRLGESQKSGYLAAFDNNTDQRLWLLKVYEIKTVEGLEADVQDVFFKSMEFTAGKKQLVIVNENDHTFLVDIINRAGKSEFKGSESLI